MSIELSNTGSSESYRRRKLTLFQKGYELAESRGVQVAIIVFQKGQYSTFSSTEDDSWPPSMETIVSNPSTIKYLN